MRALAGTRDLRDDARHERRHRARHRHRRRTTRPAIRQARINLLDHSDDDPGDPPRRSGATTTSRAAPAHDEIWGELGNDVIQGDGYVDGLRARCTLPTAHGADVEGRRPRGPAGVLADGPTGTRIGAWRDRLETTDETLVVHPSVERDDATATTTSRATAATTRSSAASARTTSSATAPTSTSRASSASSSGSTERLPGRVAGHRRLGRRHDAHARRAPLLPRAAAAATRTITVGAHRDDRRRDDHVAPGSSSITLTRAGFDWTSVGSCIGAECRPAGADLIFGGAGIEIARNDPGAATISADGVDHRPTRPATRATPT